MARLSIFAIPRDDEHRLINLLKLLNNQIFSELADTCTGICNSSLKVENILTRVNVFRMYSGDLKYYFNNI